jgi:uncharacterized repeat protein (TIGR01451 family)
LIALRLLCFATILSAALSGQTPTSVILTAAPNPSDYGQPVTLTAVVTAGATGAVTFYDGTAVLGVGTVSGTQATLTTVMLPSGTRSLRAYYRGTASYAASSSAVVPEVVVAGLSLGLRNPVAYTSSLAPTSMVVGDFNGDGKQDFAGASGSSNAVGVFLGNGDGTFKPGVSYTTASVVRALATGDFNGDGKTDLVVSSSNSNNISVLLGNGDGTFQAAVTYPVGFSTIAVAVSDFNGDGKADLVVASSAGSNVAVLLGNGDRTFGAASTFSVGATTYAIAVGDLNSDGKADIVVTTFNGVAVMLGNGNGGFASPVSSSAVSSSGFNNLVLGDFNGDGKVDVAISSNSYYSGLYVLLGNGDGSFATAVNYTTGAYPWGLLVADLDGDGKADLAVTNNYISNAVSVLFGNGDGTFKPAISYPAGAYPYLLAAGDFNGDSKADLIVTSSSSTGYAILLGGALPDLAIAVTRAGFTQGQIGASYTITVTNSGDVPSAGAIGVVITLPSNFTATNLGGNGWTCAVSTLACVRSDAIAVGAGDTITLKVNVSGSLTGNAISTFTVSGGGDQNYGNNYVADTAFVRNSTATTMTSSPNPAVLGHVVTLTATVTSGATGVVAFYDGLTYLGSATLAGGQAVLATYLLPSGVRSLRASYVGDSNYGPSFSATASQTVQATAANGLLPATSYKVEPGPNWIGSGDFNGDGKADLVTADSNSGGGVSVLLGNGDGTFRQSVSYPAGTGNFTSGVVGDFNGDGKTDVIVAGTGIYLLRGNGDGTFQAAVLLSPTANYSYGIWAGADVNGDGKLDLVGGVGSTIIIFMGNGDGTFQAPMTVPFNGPSFSSGAVADMNVDGKPDLILFNTSYNGGATVLLGNGDGTFQSPVTGPASPSYPSAFTIADFNGDGKPDVAITYWSGIALQLGNGDGTLQASVVSNLGGTPGSLAFAGDFNGDGKRDVLYSSYVSNSFNLSFGNGDGTFQPATYPGVSFSTDSNPGGLVQGDFNGDGRPDFAVSNYGTGTVNVFLSGQFSGLGVSSTHAANFTIGQTGAYQIVVQNPAFTATSGTITVIDALPAGLTATAISGTGWTCVLNTLTCTRTDALANNQSYAAITVSVNVAAGLSPSTITNRVSVTASGFQNTSTDPTVIVSATTTTQAVSPNPSTLGQVVTMTATVSSGAAGTVLFSDGAVALGTAALAGSQATFSTRLLPAGRHWLVATYSGDGTHAPSSSAVQALSVNAAAASGLSAGTSYAAGAGPWAIAAADFNRDGKTDLVAANSTANTVTVYLGSGNGTFAAGTDYLVGTKPVAVDRRLQQRWQDRSRRGEPEQQERQHPAGQRRRDIPGSRHLRYRQWTCLPGRGRSQPRWQGRPGGRERVRRYTHVVVRQR